MNVSMAIYHLSGQILSKVSKTTGKPKSPLACAAYRSGERLVDEQIGQAFYYKREVEPDAFILSPEHAPQWAQDRERLWNEVNKIEKNYNAQFAREFNVALPIELTNDQQKELVIDFCQEAFVDKGMVADIAIHRDDMNNPHFHVMLTVRPFNEDGTWGVKARREYVLDENGNHVLDKNGKKKFIKVNTTDWNTKETFNEWRKLWAEKANEYLEKNHIQERITHLSNEAIGTERLPTIHEGFAARKLHKAGKESERVNYNEAVKMYNKKIESIESYKEKKQAIEYEKKFTRKFTPKEKAILSSVAKQLRFFVNSETLAERKEQLNKWKKSVMFKPESEQKLKALSRIEKEEMAIKQAESILETEANRFIQTYYSHWDVDSLNYDEKVCIVDETLNQNDFLTDEQIDALHMGIQSERIQGELNTILRNRWPFISNIDSHMEVAKAKLNQLNDELGATKENYVEKINELKESSPKEFAVLKDVTEQITKLDHVKSLLNNFYDLEIKQHFPGLNVKSMSIEEKELIVAGYEYYGESFKINSSTVARYSTEEQEMIIDVLQKPISSQKEFFRGRFVDFQWKNPIHLLLFKEECLSNAKLSENSRQKILKMNPESIGNNNLRYAIPGYSINDLNNKSNEISNGVGASSSQIAVQSLRSMINDIFNRTDNGISKKQFEEDLQKKKKKTQYRNLGPSL